MNIRLLSLFGFLFLLSACADDEVIIDDTYDVPSTYNFENVDYDGQTQRLSMLLEMKNYMWTSVNGPAVLEADRLKAMYANDVANASFEGTYDESKQLKSKTFEQEQEKFEALIDKMAAASASTEVGSEGVAGIVTSLDGEKQYLVGPEGLEYLQLIEKGLMGACFYYQATTVYLGSGRMDVDNTTVETGKGTEMEHHWDESFGYWGVPTDFPANTAGVIFWGDYTNDRDPILGVNQPLMDAYLTGRAAISNDDLETRDQAIEDVRENFELVVATTAIHYINSTLANMDDFARYAHALSEAIAFTYSLQFNEGKKITNAEVEEVLTLIAGSADFDSMNLYNVTTSDLEAARDKLATIYEVEDNKTDF